MTVNEQLVLATIIAGVVIGFWKLNTGGGRARVAETPDYDPRYERAQTIDGAKARVIDDPEYSMDQFEADLERLHETGEYPDRERPQLEGQRIP